MKLVTHFSVPILVFVFLIFIPSSANAHSLEIDGHLGAVIHSEPNDQPVAGTTTPIYLAFKNDMYPINLSDYALTVSIANQADHIKYALPTNALSVSKRDTLSFPYVFPRIGTYDVIVTGTPHVSASVPAFTLMFDDVSVNTVASATSSFSTTMSEHSDSNGMNHISLLQNHFFHAAIIGIAIFIGTIITVRDERKKRKELS